MRRIKSNNNDLMALAGKLREAYSLYREGLLAQAKAAEEIALAFGMMENGQGMLPVDDIHQPDEGNPQKDIEAQPAGDEVLPGNEKTPQAQNEERHEETQAAVPEDTSKPENPSLNDVSQNDVPQWQENTVDNGQDEGDVPTTRLRFPGVPLPLDEVVDYYPTAEIKTDGPKPLDGQWLYMDTVCALLIQEHPDWMLNTDTPEDAYNGHRRILNAGDVTLYLLGENPMETVLTRPRPWHRLLQDGLDRLNQVQEVWAFSYSDGFVRGQTYFDMSLPCDQVAQVIDYTINTYFSD